MEEEVEAFAKVALGEASRNQTARKAAQVLLRSGSGFVVPTAQQKLLLLIEFAKRNLVV
jgi:ethanolamine utilization protein EutA (predicted chaperonin)